MREVDLEKLYDLAGPKAVALEEEMQLLTEKLLHDLPLRGFLADGGVPLKVKEEILDRAVPQASPLFRQLLTLLLKAGLINHFPALTSKYSAVISERIGACYVEVKHAQPLSEAEKVRIFSLIEGGCRVRFIQDPAVIGGIKMRWQDGRYFDASLAGDLFELKEALLV
jgi:F0F1-type ATP synthase delta subunit